MYAPVESPFEFRNCCWFCQEPAAKVYQFPQTDNHVIDCIHPPLSLLTCNECYIPATKSNGNSIWQVWQQVKSFLIKKYQKDLAIGLNWTKEELENSQFEGGNFEGFQRSAWFMFEVAQARVNFKGWPLIINGLNIDEMREQTQTDFIFDGLAYPSIDVAIVHYAQTFKLPLAYFRQVLAYLGPENFAKAVRFCRLLVGATPDERTSALNEFKKESN